MGNNDKEVLGKLEAPGNDEYANNCFGYDKYNFAHCRGAVAYSSQSGFL
jgi:hypothetical protein